MLIVPNPRSIVQNEGSNLQKRQTTSKQADEDCDDSPPKVSDEDCEEDEESDCEEDEDSDCEEDDVEDDCDDSPPKSSEEDCEDDTKKQDSGASKSINPNSAAASSSSVSPSQAEQAKYGVAPSYGNVNQLSGQNSASGQIEIHSIVMGLATLLGAAAML